MAGQLIRKGDRKWLVRVFLGRDSQTSKKKYFSKQVNGNRKDAQKFLNETLRDLDLGTFVAPNAMTLSEYLDQWLLATKPRLRERTYDGYEDLLKWHVRPTLGLKNLLDLRPLDIQALYSSLLEKGLSAKTVRHVHTTLRGALTQAVRWNMLTRNPCDAVKPPRVERKEMRSFDPKDAARFLAACENDKWGIVFAVALTTGMRPGEYLALQWKDIDLQTGIVTVQRSVSWHRGGGWYFAEPKTSRSRRNIPLQSSIVRSLKRHRRKQNEERLKAGPEYQNNDLVFATSEGTPLLLRNLLRRHFRPILKNAELPASFRLYDLRHSCATLLLAAGENPKVVSERLGHSGIAMTLDVYSHVLPSMQQAATEKLERLLSLAKRHTTDTPKRKSGTKAASK